MSFFDSFLFFVSARTSADRFAVGFLIDSCRELSASACEGWSFTKSAWTVSRGVSGAVSAAPARASRVQSSVSSLSARGVIEARGKWAVSVGRRRLVRSGFGADAGAEAGAVVVVVVERTLVAVVVGVSCVSILLFVGAMDENLPKVLE